MHRKPSPEAIRAARIEAGLPVAEVARRAGLGEATLYRIEKGRHVPRDYTVGRIAHALGVPVASLFEPVEEAS